MKKAALLLTLILTTFLISCSDDDGCPFDDIELNNYSVSFLVTDPEGNNLLDEVTEESFIWNVSVSYNGRTYVYQGDKDVVGRGTATKSPGLRIGEHAGNRILTFGEFNPADDYEDEKFTIDWGTGDKPDEVKFSLNLYGVNCQWVVENRFYVNGTEFDVEKDVIPIELYREGEEE